MAIITDHALLRYLERVRGMDIRALKRKGAKMGYVVNTDALTLAFIKRSEGLDIEALRKSLVTPELLTALRVGAKSIKTNGVTFILQGSSVVTLYPIDFAKPRTHIRPVLRPGQFKATRRWREREVDVDA